jgi:hypothetical protein
MYKQYYINISIYLFMSAVILMDCDPACPQPRSEPAVDQATREIYKPVREKAEKALMGIPGKKTEIKDEIPVPENEELVEKQEKKQ